MQQSLISDTFLANVRELVRFHNTNLAAKMTRILVVDDDLASLRLLEVVLTRAGLIPICMRDAQAAMEYAVAEPVNAIVINDVLPHTTGGEVSLMLKSKRETCHIPVLLIGTLQRVDDASYLSQVQADAGLRLPCRPPELVSTLSQLLVAPIA